MTCVHSYAHTYVNAYVHIHVFTYSQTYVQICASRNLLPEHNATNNMEPTKRNQQNPKP